MNDLIKPPSLEDLAIEARGHLRGSRADETLRAYGQAWGAFENWCRAWGLVPLPTEPTTVVLYLTERARTDKFATLKGRLAAITFYHREQGIEPNPTHDRRVKDLVAGVRKQLGARPVRKRPLDLTALRALVATIDRRSLIGARDAGLLLFGFGVALRRRFLVAVDVEHIKQEEKGLAVFVPRDKTDQDGEGRFIAVPFYEDVEVCPARALQAWLAASKIESGAVFRSFTPRGTLKSRRLSEKQVAVIVKARCAAAGFAPAGYAGHSLRAGHVTEARRQGRTNAQIQAVTGHRTTRMLDVYDREENVLLRGTGKLG